MDTNMQDKLRSLTIRARVALVLASAERVLSTLRNKRDVYQRAKAALADGWRWEMTGEGSSQQLYDQIQLLLDCEPKVAQARSQKLALFATISAMYYVTWQAAMFSESSEGIEKCSCLPNDISDVTEEEVIHCLEYSRQAAADADKEAHWRQEAVDGLLAKVGTNDPNALGAGIPPSYFQAVESKNATQTGN